MRGKLESTWRVSCGWCLDTEIMEDKGLYTAKKDLGDKGWTYTASAGYLCHYCSKLWCPECGAKRRSVPCTCGKGYVYACDGCGTRVPQRE